MGSISKFPSRPNMYPRLPPKFYAPELVNQVGSSTGVHAGDFPFSQCASLLAIIIPLALESGIRRHNIGDFLAE